MSRELVVTDRGRYFVIEGEPGSYELLEMIPMVHRTFKHKWEARKVAYGHVEAEEVES